MAPAEQVLPPFRPSRRSERQLKGRPIVVQVAGALVPLVHHHDLRRLDRILRMVEIANGADAPAGPLQQTARRPLRVKKLPWDRTTPDGRAGLPCLHLFVGDLISVGPGNYLTPSSNYPMLADMAGPARQDAQRVAAVRRFNRFYTQNLGVLQPGWL